MKSSLPDKPGHFCTKSIEQTDCSNLIGGHEPAVAYDVRTHDGV
jgi:hypothetical protein